MSDEISEDLGTRIFRPGPGGHFANGEVIVFSVVSPDGTEHRFNCHHAELPAIMKALSSIGAMAEGARAGQPGAGVMEASRPVFVVGDPSVSIIQGKDLPPLVQAIVPVHEGFPLVFAMAPETARALATGLLAGANGELPQPPTRQ